MALAYRQIELFELKRFIFYKFGLNGRLHQRAFPLGKPYPTANIYTFLASNEGVKEG